MPAMRVFMLMGLLSGLVGAAQDFGTGRDGAKLISGTEVVNRYSPLNADQLAGSTRLSVVVGNLAPGELVMLLDTQVPTLPNSGIPGAFYLTSSISVGTWEFVRIAQALGSGLYELEQPLKRTWRASGSQAVVVPEFTVLTVADGGVLTGLPWDGASGGVIAALAQDGIAIDGAISADGLGFRGRSPLQESNGEGVSASPGMNKSEYSTVSGGFSSAGGSNCGTGGSGSAGRGARALKATAGERVLLGGGGGPVQGILGGSGGGVIFLRAISMSGSGSVSADGRKGADNSAYWASGGGAGGTINVRVAGSLSCSELSARGGRGGSEMSSGTCMAGGGGSGGRIYVEAQALSSSCTLAVQAGLAGVVGPGVSNCATPTDPDDPLSGGEAVARFDGGSGLSPTAPLRLTAPTSGSVLAVARPVIAGRSTVADVKVFLDGAEAGAASLLPDGGFIFFPSADLPDGEHRVSARAPTGESSGEVRFTIDTVPPDAPEVLRPRPNEVLATPTPSIEGTAQPGAMVRVSVDGQHLFSAVVSSTGTFLTAVPAIRALERGKHAVEAITFDEAGNSASSTVEFSVGRTPEDPPLKVSGCTTSGLGPSVLFLALLLLIPRSASLKWR